MSKNRKQKVRLWGAVFAVFLCMCGLIPVSYTHLDVYKRQACGGVLILKNCCTTDMYIFHITDWKCTAVFVVFFPCKMKEKLI